MKLRLKGNTIRLRLTQSEVAELAAGARVAEVVEFGSENSRFSYSIRTTDNPAVAATFDGGEICVQVPEDSVREWAGSDIVTMGSDDAAPLRILVEKDFACPNARPGEDESDMYPNPADAACRP